MSSTWTFGGTNLSSTYGNITVLDDSLDIPDARGSNIVIPYKHGTIHVNKYFDERIIAFGIAIAKANSAAIDAAIDSLHTLIGPRQQQVLSHTREDTTVRTALACVEKNLQVKRIGDRLVRVVVEFTLAQPFFRLSTIIADNTTTINASPKAMVVTNPGTVEERDPVILLSGPLTNVTITNSTNGAILTYTGVIDAGETVTIQTSASGEYTATHSVDGDVIGNVTHSGAPALMVFNIGVNTLSITSSVTTTGTVKASFYAPFLSG
jgi:hypothetical protein